mmetsp:Transcript_115584/g.333925  ORF Transcript_115584/g.333925 Transcript_115584/m.333925 type:complete len:617 (+) Transcript_115584:824-2674(+)
MLPEGSPIRVPGECRLAPENHHAEPRPCERHVEHVVVGQDSEPVSSSAPHGAQDHVVPLASLGCRDGTHVDVGPASQQRRDHRDLRLVPREHADAALAGKRGELHGQRRRLAGLAPVRSGASAAVRSPHSLDLLAPCVRHVEVPSHDAHRTAFVLRMPQQARRVFQHRLVVENALAIKVLRGEGADVRMHPVLDRQEVQGDASAALCEPLKQGDVHAPGLGVSALQHRPKLLVVAEEADLRGLHCEGERRQRLRLGSLACLVDDDLLELRRALRAERLHHREAAARDTRREDDVRIAQLSGPGLGECLEVRAAKNFGSRTGGAVFQHGPVGPPGSCGLAGGDLAIDGAVAAPMPGIGPNLRRHLVGAVRLNSRVVVPPGHGEILLLRVRAVDPEHAEAAVGVLDATAADGATAARLQRLGKALLMEDMIARGHRIGPGVQADGAHGALLLKAAPQQLPRTVGPEAGHEQEGAIGGAIRRRAEEHGAVFARGQVAPCQQRRQRGRRPRLPSARRPLHEGDGLRQRRHDRLPLRRIQGPDRDVIGDLGVHGLERQTAVAQHGAPCERRARQLRQRLRHAAGGQSLRDGLHHVHAIRRVPVVATLNHLELHRNVRLADF